MALNNDFPVPLAKFIPLMQGTSDEVWIALLTLEHGDEKHTELEWDALLRTYTGPRS